MALKELEHESRITVNEYQIEAAIHSGYSIWNCPRADVRTHELEFLTGARNTWQPNPALPSMPIQRVRVVENDPSYPGFSRITATYMKRNMYNPYVFPVNSTTIEIRGNPYEKQITHAWTDLSGGTLQRCNGPDKEHPHKHFWRVVEGSDIKLIANSIIVLRTAILPVNLNWPALIARFNEVNSDTISEIGASPRTLMLVEAYVPRVYLLGSDTEYIPIALGFRYEPSPGFLSNIKTQKFTKAVYNSPLHAYNGGEIDDALYVLKTNPDSTTSDSSLAEKRAVLVDMKVGDQVELYTLRQSSFSGFFNLTWWQ